MSRSPHPPPRGHHSRRDGRGREGARPPARPGQLMPDGRRRGLRPGNWLAFLLLIALPCRALFEQARWIDWRILSFAPVCLTAIAFFLYRHDKQRAQAGGWRIPETTLHFIDLIGGWPGGFLAQREYRHKTVKGSFQFIFWMTVALHQFLALDSLLAWRLTKELLRRFASGGE